jgi:hypothetical protein
VYPGIVIVEIAESTSGQDVLVKLATAMLSVAVESIPSASTRLQGAPAVLFANVWAADAAACSELVPFAFPTLELMNPGITPARSSARTIATTTTITAAARRVDLETPDRGGEVGDGVDGGGPGIEPGADMF